jgi:hypothetical protein
MSVSASSKELFYRTLLKRALWAFGVSASLNVIFVTFAIYEWQEGGGLFTPLPSFSEEIAIVQATYQNTTLENEVTELSQLPFTELLSLLDNKTNVCDGYKKRDVALSVLVSLHSFHLEKALQGHLPKQAREMTIASKKMTFYPGLLDEHYNCLRHFAAIEKWPLTCKGLFLKLREQRGKEVDASLRLAFMQTEEYHHWRSIFTRDSGMQDFGMQDSGMKEDQLLAVILEADWTVLQSLSKVRQPEVYREVRRTFLLNIMKTNRPLALEALVACDFSFALHQFDDLDAILVLERMQTKPEALRLFALGLLKSPRSDEVWQKASAALCQLAQLDPELYSREKLLEHFGVIATEKKIVPNFEQKAQQGAPKAISEVVYIVQPGDSLWIISKKFRVDIATIKKHNQLQSDALKPGTSLRIPVHNF